jgi:hypothetical protein
MRKGSKLTPKHRRKAIAALRRGTATRWSKSLEERFWEKVVKGKSDECWLWKASLNMAGYGQLYRDGRPIVASRISWELANGPIPAGVFVLHRCDTPACVNPKHLFLGTQVENIADMWRKGRARPWPGPRLKGEACAVSKLTDAKVQDMRRRFKNGERLQRLADRYGVDRMTIKSAVTRKTWRHVK